MVRDFGGWEGVGLVYDSIWSAVLDEADQKVVLLVKRTVATRGKCVASEGYKQKKSHAYSCQAADVASQAPKAREHLTYFGAAGDRCRKRFSALLHWA